MHHPQFVENAWSKGYSGTLVFLRNKLRQTSITPASWVLIRLLHFLHVNSWLSVYSNMHHSQFHVRSFDASVQPIRVTVRSHATRVRYCSMESDWIIKLSSQLRLQCMWLLFLMITGQAECNCVWGELTKAENCTFCPFSSVLIIQHTQKHEWRPHFENWVDLDHIQQESEECLH
jgi:hypothetical protein